MAAGGALAQATKQLLLFLGVVQLDRELAHVADDRAHQCRIGAGLASARGGQGVHPGVHDRGQRPMLVADDADRARRRGRLAHRRDQQRQAGIHQHLEHPRHECHAELAVATVRRHEDQVAALLARRGDDRLRRPVADDMARIARHAERSRRGHGLGQQLLRLAEVRVFVFVPRGQAEHVGVAAERGRSVGDGVEEGDARAERPREGDGVADDRDRQVGVVDGNKQMVVHDRPRATFSILGSRSAPLPPRRRGAAEKRCDAARGLTIAIRSADGSRPVPRASAGRRGVPWPNAPRSSQASQMTCC